MARVKIREFDAKKLLLQNLKQEYKGIMIDFSTDLNTLVQQYPWLLEQRLVIKPDQLFGKRGKLGLVLIDATFEQVKEYLLNRLNNEFTIGKVTDKLTHFLVEPYIQHEKEYYLSITSERDHDIIHFSEEGGIDVEENWHKISTIQVPTLGEPNLEKINAPEKTKEFIRNIFGLYKKFHFCYLEFNPFTIDKNDQIILIDTVAQVDSCGITLPHPKPFGRKSHPEEEHIAALDQESSASLKLTVLNPKGRIWNILSGGGASIIYLDTIANLDKQEEIANYGEYSGNPTTEETYQYTKTILSLMTKEYHPQGKVLIIGGAIANFTDIEKTFSGIIKALQEYKTKLQKGRISIFVRRGGPNYERGLKLMEQTGKELGIPIVLNGPEIPMVNIVKTAIEALQ